MGIEQGYRHPVVYYDTLDRTGASGREVRGSSEDLRPNISEHFSGFYNTVELSPDLDRKSIIEEATAHTFAALERANRLADTLGSPLFVQNAEAQRRLLGCAIGISHCPDGGLPTLHLAGFMAGATETLAGIPLTARSPLTGRELPTSPHLLRAITRRPVKPNDQLLQILIAHDHCGRMEQIRQEAATQGKPFGDPILENLKLFEGPMEAIDRTYNDARQEGGKRPLEQVCVRAVFSKGDMGMTFGYDTDTPISTIQLLRYGLADEIVTKLADYQDPRLAAPGAFADSFGRLDTQIAREHLKTMLMTTLMQNLEQGTGIFSEGMHTIYSLDEYKRLSPEQKKALAVFIARQIARSFLGGQYLDGSNGRHPHAHHHEIAQAVSLNGNPIGTYDPEVQYFGSNPPDIPSAAVNIVTKTAIMDGIPGGLSHPYPLLISYAIPEEMRRGGRGEADAAQTLRMQFNQILNQEPVAKLVRDGKVAPIPVLTSSRSHSIRGIVPHALF